MPHVAPLKVGSPAPLHNPLCRRATPLKDASGAKSYDVKGQFSSGGGYAVVKKKGGTLYTTSTHCRLYRRLWCLMRSRHAAKASRRL